MIENKETSSQADGWSLLDFSDASAIAQSLATARSVMPSAGLGARYYDVEFELGPSPDWSDLRTYVFRDGDTVKGLAPFIRRHRPLKFVVGEFGIASVPMTRYLMFGDAYLTPDLDDERAAASAQQLITTCIQGLRRGEALFLEGLPLESHIYRSLQRPDSIGTHFVTIELCLPYEHQFIRFPAAYKEYLSQLGSKSRHSLRNSQNKLAKDMDGSVSIRCFETVDDVGTFVVDAESVSKKTYQWNLLGLGLRDSNQTRDLLRFYADRGWFQSFIMYCRGTPTAFMLGYRYGDVYYPDEMGYDPAYAKWSVGSLLTLGIIEQLIERPDRPAFWDYTTGYGEHKGRFGNMSRSETNLLVLPASMRNRSIALAYSTIDSTSRAAVAFLDRLGIKARLKKLIRRSSGPG